ncbi:hypothetical protein H012_gp433 [Acanthamoeba polyphaga moumouvirus]|uniref:Uncharacterized protein n=2 Tax=Moumouvirus TaxID=3080801 RepID=L7RCQ6_9VIRU|nr:hypothetical protein H012_gp433 [Acanthamoeba polyphaga moumouvirus]AGC02026.1 hypothetical protein Moumou_00492 [Acanthamoeba polyphaga moumouvirus]
MSITYSKMYMGSALPLIISIIPNMKKNTTNNYFKFGYNNINDNLLNEDDEIFKKEQLREKIFNKLYEIINLRKNYTGKYIKICCADKNLNFYLNVIKSTLFESDLLFKIMIRKFLSIRYSIYIKFYDKQKYSQKITKKFYDIYSQSNDNPIVVRDKINSRNEILAETIARNYNIVLKNSGYKFEYKQYIRKVFVIESDTIFHEYCVYTFCD